MSQQSNHCSVKRVLKQALKYKKELLVGNAAAIVATLTTVIIPLFVPMLIDELLLHRSDTVTGWIATHVIPLGITGYVVLFLVLTLLLRTFGFFLNVIQVRVFMGISKELSLKLRQQVLGHLEKVTLKEYELASPGAITSKIVTDINTVDGFIGTTVSKFVVSILTLLFISIVLIAIDWRLALFILLTNPLVVFYTSKIARGIGQLKARENKATEQLQSSLSETLGLFRQIKSSNKEHYFFSLVDKKAIGLKDTAIEFGYRSDRAIRASFLIFLSGYELFRAVGILAVAYGDLSVGMMLAVFGYLWVMMTPTQDIINFQYAYSNARLACGRINDIYKMETEKIISGAKNPFAKASPVDIKIEGLSFSYNSGTKILKNINMDIPKYSKIAIVGASGSGKTTLANLIVGLYPVDEGKIFYNDTCIQEIELHTIRTNSHLILQYPQLFNDTLYKNLTLGEVHSDKDIANAIEIAQLREVVDRLTDGLQTIVGQDGIKLSGGQRQRVSIARMILIDPQIVILDESTSALDVHTESMVFEGLEEYLEKKTVITIAHRLSTIQKAEYIYILEDGVICDEGKPSELMAKDDSYFSKMI